MRTYVPSTLSILMFQTLDEECEEGIYTRNPESSTKVRSIDYEDQ